MPITNFSRFRNGITINDIPLILTQNKNGNVFWVDSSNQTAANGGKGTFEKPFASIDYAVGRCTADQGDIIMVAANHTESIVAAGTLTIDVDGIIIVFMGEGDSRAKLSYGTLTTASTLITANSVTLINPKLVTTLDAIHTAITISGTDCILANVEVYGAASKAILRAVLIENTAVRTKILGYKFFDSTAGTQKVYSIGISGASYITLKDIHIVGDFSDGNIDNSGAATTVLSLENVVLNNLNVGPIPGFTNHANTTGMAKNLDIRVASGTTYTTSVGKINWDNNCLGYNADGYGGDPIGTSSGSSIEAKIDAIDANVGDPSARTNFQSLEAMIGIPDAANSCLDDIIRSGFDSTAITANLNGSALEILKYISSSLIPDMGGLVFAGTCDTGMTGSTTTVVCAGLAGYVDDSFNNKYYMQIILNANAAGVAPEDQVRQITDYDSTTGTFTTAAFGANVEEADKFLVLHESFMFNGLDIDAITTDSLQGKIGTDTELADRSLFDLLGGDGFTTYPAAAAPANDVSLAEVARAIYDDTDTISGAALPAAPAADSLAAFIASGGTALGTELADSKSLVDAIGSDGTTLSYGSGSVLGAVGTVVMVYKVLTSSAILQAGVDVTAVSTDGQLMIEDIYMNTDATGLAGGTNFQLETDNAKGVTVFFAETVANLGANKTENIASGSVTAITGTVLETGKKIIARATVADCTGAGTITLAIKLRRVAAGANIAAA